MLYSSYKLNESLFKVIIEFMKDQNKEQMNVGSKNSVIIFALLFLAILQFIYIRKTIQSISSVEQAIRGLITTQNYYDDLSSLKNHGLAIEEKLKGRVFCAYREDLSFKFKFNKQQVTIWITSLTSPKIYKTQEERPVLITNYHNEGNHLYWNVELLGKSYSFNGIPIIYENSPSLIRGKTEILTEFTDDHSC